MTKISLAARTLGSWQELSAGPTGLIGPKGGMGPTGATGPTGYTGTGWYVKTSSPGGPTGPTVMVGSDVSLNPNYNGDWSSDQYTKLVTSGGIAGKMCEMIDMLKNCRSFSLTNSQCAELKALFT